MSLPILLIISGFDPFNLAGYGSDIRVATNIGIHPVGIITALTAQVPGKLTGISSVDIALIKKQFQLLSENYDINTIKIGMVYDLKILKIILKFLNQKSYNVIIDPIYKATAGPELIKNNSLRFFKKHILKKACLITPNIPEAYELLNIKKETPENELLSKLYKKFKVPILLKGGHGGANKKCFKDLFYNGIKVKQWERKQIKNINTHGSGCILSSAIASYVAKGCTLTKAIDNAQEYLNRCFERKIKIKDSYFLSHF